MTIQMPVIDLDLHHERLTDIDFRLEVSAKDFEGVVNHPIVASLSSEAILYLEALSAARKAVENAAKALDRISALYGDATSFFDSANSQ